MDGYFVVELAGGTVLDFDKKCTKVDYSDKEYCVFKHIYESGEECLAIVPHRNIFTIIKMVEE